MAIYTQLDQLHWLCEVNCWSNMWDGAKARMGTECIMYKYLSEFNVRKTFVSPEGSVFFFLLIIEVK